MDKYLEKLKNRVMDEIKRIDAAIREQREKEGDPVREKESAILASLRGHKEGLKFSLFMLNEIPEP